MAFLDSIKGWLKGFGSIIVAALTAAVGAGLTDEIVKLAKTHVITAATKFVEDDAKREWVVKQLMKTKISESISRLATELAYQAVKTELDKLAGK